MPFLSIFLIISVVVLAILLRKNSKNQQQFDEEFWRKEQEANNTRRQDLSKLNYITIPIDKFPPRLHTSAEQKLHELSTQKIVNLTGITNTELKTTYGVANLELLTEYDENYTVLIATIIAYSKELLEHNDTTTAITLLEYAMSIYADASYIYTTLAKLYTENGNIDKAQDLIPFVEQLPLLSKESTIDKIKAYLP